MYFWMQGAEGSKQGLVDGGWHSACDAYAGERQGKRRVQVQVVWVISMSTDRKYLYVMARSHLAFTLYLMLLLAYARKVQEQPDGRSKGPHCQSPNPNHHPITSLYGGKNLGLETQQ